MGVRIIGPGDTISKLARAEGLTWQTVWEHEKNAELREKREDPNILYPGDELFVPEPTKKDESAATAQKHRYKSKGALEIRVAVVDAFHEPMADVEYSFVIDGEELDPETTDSEGIAETKLPKTASEVALRLPWGEIPVELGHLDPTRTIKGLQQRLRNLGIHPGPIDGILGRKTSRAIREFQEMERAAKLEPTGLADPDTIKRLRDLHDGLLREGVHNEVETGVPALDSEVPRSEIDTEDLESDIDEDDQEAGEEPDDDLPADA